MPVVDLSDSCTQAVPSKRDADLDTSYTVTGFMATMMYYGLRSWFPDGHERRWTSDRLMSESVCGKCCSAGLQRACRSRHPKQIRRPVFQNALVLYCSERTRPQGAGVRAVEGDHHADMEEKSLLTVTNDRQTAVAMCTEALIWDGLQTWSKGPSASKPGKHDILANRISAF